METMKRMKSKKSHSWWWDSHISPKNSTWLAESLEEMDRLVKEMLKLIEEEADSFAKKAEMYYQRRPELVSHVEKFYRMYRALAERYDQVTGELRRSIPSGPQSQGSAGNLDFGSEAPSLSQSPPPASRKLSHSKSRARATGFAFFLGSGGSSDSRKDSDGSSSSESESESDGDDAKEMSGAMDPDHLCPGIIQLESELRDMKEKLLQYEQTSGDAFRCMETEGNQGLPSRVTELEAELTATNEELRDSEKVIKQLRQELEKSVQVGAELDLLRKERSELETQITTLEATMSNYRCEIEQLNSAHSVALEKLISDMFDRDKAIQEYEAELATLRERSSHENICLEADLVDHEDSTDEMKAPLERFSQEKMLLEAKIGDQVHVIEELKDMIANSSKKLSEEKLKLEKDILRLSESHESLEKKLALLEDERRQLEIEKTEVCASRTKIIEELRQNLDAFKLQVDVISSEKAELGAKVSALVNDVKFRDDRIHEMDVHLQQLHLEHVRLITETENAQKARTLMNERVKNLEEEVERQQAMLCDGAEKKREAIRQLCFSLEHYRDEYNQLKQVLLDHRRLPTVLAS